MQGAARPLRLEESPIAREIPRESVSVVVKEGSPNKGEDSVIPEKDNDAGCNEEGQLSAGSNDEGPRGAK